jgi:hypothetical protein
MTLPLSDMTGVAMEIDIPYVLERREYMLVINHRHRIYRALIKKHNPTFVSGCSRRVMAFKVMCEDNMM